MNSKVRTATVVVPRPAKPVDFKEIVTALAAWKFPSGIDGVVAIASGGVVPAALVAQRLGVGMKTITINYRDEMNEPRFAQPKLVSSAPGLGDWRRVLLVDDIYMSGKSWQVARKHLPSEVDVLPFVLKGDVEFALIRAKDTYAEWPWSSF